MKDILVEWKKNVQLSKWTYFKSNVPEFQNNSIDHVIEIFRSFFHESDLDKSLLEKKNHISEVDPSEYWLYFILSQTNPGTILLVHEMSKAIEFYQKRNLNYLRSKLLMKNGKIDKKSFRDKYFEVFLNYNLEKSGIKVNFEKCYRNEFNMNDEGFDSYFKFNNQTYVLECLKIKTMQENLHSAAYKMIQILAKTLKKNPNKSHVLPVSIFAKMSGDFRNVELDFRTILKASFHNKSEYGLNEIREKSRSYNDLRIFQNSDTKKILESYPELLKDYMRISAQFKGIKILDRLNKDIGIDFTKAESERHEYEILCNYKTLKISQNFEDHLMVKIKKKISQLNKCGIEKKILAIEIESYTGFGISPVKINYRFNQVFNKVNPNLSIILFFKDSRADNLLLNKKSFFDNNDKFMRYFLYGVM